MNDAIDAEGSGNADLEHPAGVQASAHGPGRDRSALLHFGDPYVSKGP
jgi:hypothetical protein